MTSPRHRVLILVALFLPIIAATLADAAGPTPIAIGENVIASLDVVGERDTYTFDAAAGDVIWIRMVREGSFIEPRMNLSGPGGGTIATSSEGVATSDILDLPLTETGTYVLEVYDSLDNETGAYSAQVIRIGDGTPIEFGPPGCDNIEASSDRDVFTFDAAAGDLVWLGVATPNSAQPRTRLYGPDGSLVLVGSTSNSWVDLLDVVLPASGTYSLVVYSDSPAAGAYCYHLLRISDPVDDVLIEYGPVYSDSVATLGEIDAFTFEGVAGDVVWIRMGRQSAIDANLRLYDPAGNHVSSIGGIAIADLLDVTLPLTGTYTLLAYDDFSNETGAYDLQLLRISDPVDAVVTDFGPVHCGTYDTFAKRDAYRIDGTAGDVVWFRLVSASVQPRIRLYGPDFVHVVSSDTDNTLGDILDFVLPSTGPYTLVVFTNSAGVNGQPYCLHSLRISDPNDDVAIEYGPVTAGTIDQSAEVDAYTFSADAGDILWARMPLLVGPMEPRLRLYGPDHTLLAGGTEFITYSDIFGVTLPAAGTYTLLAYDFRSNETGSYSVHLLRQNDPTDGIDLILGAEYCASAEVGAVDAYTFPALTGDSIRARMTEETAALEPALALLAPDGSVVVGGTTGNPVVEILATNLPVDGVYTLLAYDETSNEAGDYRVEAELCVDDPCGEFCPGDITNDRQVAFSDILGVLSTWGPCDCCPADIDGDGMVAFSDLLIILSAWGPCL